MHEIELQLRSAAANLIHNTRFMATLPPVEGIIRARAGSADDSEETWKERLKTIYTGLLRANPDYLAVSYIAASTSESEDAAAPGSAEILRVERNVNDRSFVRTVPESRLATVDNNAVLADVIRLEPGDVRLTYADPRGRETAANDLKRISGCVPIYGEATGVPFGMVAIETDLVGQLEAVVQTLGTVDGEIYIADGEGTVLISTGPDAAAGATAIKSIPAEIPELAPLFEADAEALTRTDGATYFARRFRVDATSKGVAIVARLGE